MMRFLDFLEQEYQGQEPILKDVRQEYIRYIRQEFDDAVAMNWIEGNPPEVLREIVKENYITRGGSDCNPLYEYVCLNKKIAENQL